MRKARILVNCIAAAAATLIITSVAFAASEVVTGLTMKTSSTQYFLSDTTALVATTYRSNFDDEMIAYPLQRGAAASSETVSLYAGLSEAAKTGVLAIMQNGYPSLKGAEYTDITGLSDDELKYATAIALQAWMHTCNQNGGVNPAAVVPSAYPSLPEEQKRMTISMDSLGLYSVTLKPSVTYSALASYERAYIVYAYLYNEAMSAGTVPITGTVAIQNATDWTPSGKNYVCSFTAVATGQCNDTWVTGLPTSATVDIGPAVKGAIPVSISVPASDLSDVTTPQFVIGHTSHMSRYGIYKDNAAGSVLAIASGASGVVASADIPVTKYESKLQIKITDAVSGAAIKDAKVEVYATGRTTALAVIDVYPSTASAFTTYTALAPGSYEFAVTSIPQGYDKPTQRYSFTIAADGTASGSTTATVSATPTQGNVSGSKLTVKFGAAPVSGVSATFYSAGGAAALSAVSDTDGQIDVSSLTPGSYTYKLTALPDGYASDGTVRNLVIADTGVSGDLEVLLEKAYFSVKKTDSAGNPLSGVTFTLYNASGTAVSSVVTDLTGTASFTGLANGQYKILETMTVAGQTLSTDSYTFTVTAGWTNSRTPYLWGGGTTDSGLKSTTRMTKSIILMYENSTPIVNATLTVYSSSGTAVLSAASGSTGAVDVSALAVGKYTYKLTTVPETYAIDGNTHSFEINDSGLISGYIDLPVKKAEVAVQKSGNLSGVTYTLYNSSGAAVTTAVTDGTGVAKFTGLTLGSFTIKETATVSGKTLSTRVYEFTVTNAWVNPGTYDFDGIDTANYATRASKAINVKSADAAVAGAVVTVYNSAGTALLTATTNTYGVADVSALSAGSYTYKLTAAPSTYAIDGLPHSFTIDTTGAIAGAIDLSISKVEVKVKKLAKNGTDAVAGVTYTLYDNANTAVTTALTDATGIAKFSALIPGAYTIKETATVSGLALSSDTYTFAVSNTWVNSSEPRIFQSAATVQTGAATYALVTLVLAVIAGAIIAIRRTLAASRK